MKVRKQVGAICSSALVPVALSQASERACDSDPVTISTSYLLPRAVTLPNDHEWPSRNLRFKGFPAPENPIGRQRVEMSGLHR